MNITPARQRLSITLLLGLSGGLVLAAFALTANFLDRPFVRMMLFGIVPYVLLISATLVYLRARKVFGFLPRFVVLLGVFMTATIIMAVYTIVETSIRHPGLTTTIWHRTWPLLLMIVPASIISGIVALITPVREART